MSHRSSRALQPRTSVHLDLSTYDVGRVGVAGPRRRGHHTYRFFANRDHTDLAFDQLAGQRGSPRFDHRLAARCVGVVMGWRTRGRQQATNLSPISLWR